MHLSEETIARAMAVIETPDEIEAARQLAKAVKDACAVLSAYLEPDREFAVEESMTRLMLILDNNDVADALRVIERNA